MITVVAATADYALRSHALAIALTLGVIPIECQGLLLSLTKPNVEFGGKWKELDCELVPQRMWTVADYNRFVLSELDRHIDTEFCVLVQRDGYGLNRHLWRDEFLEYDYIGAPWTKEGHSVGNGGFSLRSKRWIRTTRKLQEQFPCPEWQNEDWWACCSHRDFMVNQGLRIASVELAALWSFEFPHPKFPEWNPTFTFGFHGVMTPETLDLRLPNL